MYREAGSIAPDDISADHAQVLFTRGISNRESKLLLLDLASGKATQIAPKAGKVLYPNARLSRDGRSVYAISTKDSDFGRLVQIDIASGKDTVLTPDLKWDVETLHDLRRRSPARVRRERGRVLERRRARPRHAARSAAAAAAARRVAEHGVLAGQDASSRFDLSTATSAGDVWTWEVTGGNLARWTTSELGGLDPAKLAEPQLVRFKSFDGLSVPALVYRPAGVAADVRTPVIMDIHGGPESQTRPSWNVGAQYFAAVLGATVILPNVRGSTGYGKRYADLDNAEKREDSVKDIGALLDWIATQPNLDKNRVVVYGQSYGGYMSLAVSTHYADRLSRQRRALRHQRLRFVPQEHGSVSPRQSPRGVRRRARSEDAGGVQAHRAARQRREDHQADAGDAGRERSARAEVGVGPGRRRHSRERRRDVVRRVRRRRPWLPEEAEQRPAPRSGDGVPAQAVQTAAASGGGIRQA